MGEIDKALKRLDRHARREALIIIHHQNVFDYWRYLTFVNLFGVTVGMN